MVRPASAIALIDQLGTVKVAFSQAMYMKELFRFFEFSASSVEYE